MIPLVELPEIENGPWKISKFTVTTMDWHSALRERSVPMGKSFTRLTRSGTLVMSDTPAEQRDHLEAVDNAIGSCLLNGLGLGMVLKAILLKPEVTDVTVVEISQELIDLVSPFYRDSRIEYVCSDALTYIPPKRKRYQMVWHDIWDTICADNLTEMKALHRRYGRRADWQGSWCRGQCERYR